MMATYFHGGSEIQAPTGSDNLQTLYLMNPNYFSNAYNNTTSSEPPNMLLLNPSSTAAGPTGSGHMHHQQLIGIPLGGPHHSDNSNSPHGRTTSSGTLHPNDQSPHHMTPPSLHGMAVSRVHYNLWSPTVDQSPTQHGPISSTTQGGLSLSLSPHQHNPSMSVTVAAGGEMSSLSNNDNNNNNGSGVGVILGSKYLKATQELLDEVIKVGNDIDQNSKVSGESSGFYKDKAKAKAKEMGSGDGEGSNGGGGDKKVAEQLTTAQRQELQMKKAKLISMLDEVEQRYRQYHTQMQIVVSSFEQAAGIGSAKSYTSLALKTISKQFRCLKDSIATQIKETSMSLGEEETNNVGPGGKLEGGAGSRLRFVDHQLRQQRALQQLGMMQHNAWRPQRGLPERAVSVLRAWLFEHFLHPYPKDSDKHLLAKQTGLTRSQVSNWFINARVRLWKPMVEEMYLEEVKSQGQNGGKSEENPNTTNNNDAINDDNHNKDQTSPSKSMSPQQHEHQQGGSSTGIEGYRHHPSDHHVTNDMISNLSTTSSQGGFTLIGSSSDMESLMAQSPKKQRSGSEMHNSPSSILSMDMEMKPANHDHHHHDKFGQGQRHLSMLNPSQGGGGPGFNPYIVNHDMGRFNQDQLTAHQYNGNNGVSLTLGLPRCESLSLSNNHQQNFMPNQGMELGRRLDNVGAGEADFCGISMGQPSNPNNGYDSIDIQNRKRFAAQLMHDFVA